MGMIHDEFNRCLPFILLLQSCGFKEFLQPQHVLRFHMNETNMMQLADAVISLKSGAVPNEQSQEEQGNFEAKCVCGSVLVETTAPEVGQNQKVLCDNCFVEFEPNETIFECRERNTSAHQFGFHLCLRCKRFPSQKKQGSASHEEESFAIDDEDSKMDEVVSTSRKTKATTNKDL